LPSSIALIFVSDIHCSNQLLAARPFTIAINMRLLKFFLLFTFLLCFMEPCLVEADTKSTFAVFRGGLSRRVGFVGISSLFLHISQTVGFV